jgi:SAM-dependent methyltransferase
MALNSVYDDRPHEYERYRQCWLNHRRAKFIAGKIRQYALPDGADVLELGSGTGWLLRDLGEQFPRLNFWGVEPLESYVDFSRERTRTRNVRYFQGTAETVDKLLRCKPLAVLSNDVLHHVVSLADTARGVSRISSPGCRWLAIEPNCKNLYAFVAQSLRHDERNFWPGEFRTIAKTACWSAEEQQYLFLIPPFVSSPPEWLKRVERMLESIPFLGGGVCLQMRLTAPAESAGGISDVSAGPQHAPVFVR